MKWFHEDENGKEEDEDEEERSEVEMLKRSKRPVYILGSKPLSVVYSEENNTSEYILYVVLYTRCHETIPRASLERWEGQDDDDDD